MICKDDDEDEDKERSFDGSPLDLVVPVLKSYNQDLMKFDDSEKRYQCIKCSKSYKNKRHLYRHEKEECIDIAPKYKCAFCLNMFRRKYHLSRHMLSRHGM